MKANQKGFSVVEILIVIVVVGLLAVAGWLVYDRQKNRTDDKAATQTSTTQPKSDNSSNESVLEGFKKYDDANFSMQYPNLWKTSTKNDQPEWVFFTSSDFKLPQTEGPGPSAESGYLLEVRIAKSRPEESFSNSLKNAKEALGAIGGTYTVIKIDGKDAILSDQKTHGTYIAATTFSGGKTYYFRLNAVDENKPEVKDLFNTILSTINIK